MSPPLEPKVIELPNGRILLQADASRAVLDGWDGLHTVLWSVLACFALGNALIYALMGRALRPLHALVDGLRQDLVADPLRGHGGLDATLDLSGHGHGARSIQGRRRGERGLVGVGWRGFTNGGRRMENVDGAVAARWRLGYSG